MDLRNLTTMESLTWTWQHMALCHSQGNINGHTVHFRLTLLLYTRNYFQMLHFEANQWECPQFAKCRVSQLCSATRTQHNPPATPTRPGARCDGCV